MNAPVPQEPQAVAERYARRAATTDRYSLLQPDVWQSLQERQRAEWQIWARLGWHDLPQRRYTEVGCGAGGALLEALRAGFAPEHLTGLELLPERHAIAQRVLPASVSLHLGDATSAPIAPGSQHVVAQHTVFSSLLDHDFQAALAAAMWRWVMPGGGVLWYDFTMDNPRNPDVRGVPLRRVRELFPQGTVRPRRITLAPPIARRVCRVHPALYTALNSLPLLRTHLLCWIQKH
ncbi:class I SAM-dependent methyltransferase [Ideonella sp. BN130291]|uniref:class I SAM-dependent methyltransferase n=1 Tax=Ideonella sp. BN130291 TaxID=3112940 RepID=UPI002E2674EA|nr:class I SAM-dependent methyltransferase [Ideonella sp. BN130291]